MPLHEPQCNIVVFRYVPQELRDAPAEVLGRFQLDLRRQVIESGRFYIVSTQIDGVGALRVTIINPLTTAEHLDELLETIREAGEKSEIRMSKSETNSNEKIQMLETASFGFPSL